MLQPKHTVLSYHVLLLDKAQNYTTKYITVHIKASKTILVYLCEHNC